LVAPFRATVIEQQVSEGQLVDAASVPFRLADLSTVWALLDVPRRCLIPMNQRVRSSLAVIRVSGTLRALCMRVVELPSPPVHQ
jgi:hypothetical protein